jgi:glucose/arabinose dehydrogenase
LIEDVSGTTKGGTMKTTKSLIVILSILAVPASTALPACVQIEDAFPMLSFTRPVDLQNAADGSDRLFVVEQRGMIYVFENNPTVTSKTVFLDIQSQVNDVGSEEGLLGLAFHPDYADSGIFYVDYTASSPRRSVISRFRVSAANPDSADPASEEVILEVDQPYANHNGGQLRFGPQGHLWISLGDGGSGGDPEGNGQDPTTLLGSILRIDPDTTEGSLKYGIPPDNPFVGNMSGYREEIYAYGLRNPWRFSFDPMTGRVWAGDVGQGAYEEVDIIESGRNYGWNIMEGFHCYNAPNCDTTGLTLPVWEYGHNDSGGFAITGGFVYRGDSVPGLYGSYIYGDYVSGRIWALDYDGTGNPVNRELLSTALNISSFGVDADQELYLCAFDGHIYRFSCIAGVEDIPGAGELGSATGASFPNPFRSETVIPVDGTLAGSAGQVLNLEIVDVRGRIVRTLSGDVTRGANSGFRWDGTDKCGRAVAGGPYLYRLTVDGRLWGTGKTVLIR